MTRNFELTINFKAEDREKVESLQWWLDNQLQEQTEVVGGVEMVGHLLREVEYFDEGE